MDGEIRDLKDREDIDILLAEGYTLRIDITLKALPDDPDGELLRYHAVTVWDGNRQVSKGEGWWFLEAMVDAYTSTPERVKGE